MPFVHVNEHAQQMPHTHFLQPMDQTLVLAIADRFEALIVREIGCARRCSKAHARAKLARLCLFETAVKAGAITPSSSSLLFASQPDGVEVKGSYLVLMSVPDSPPSST